MIYACFGITCRSWSCICAAVWGNFGIKFLKSSNKIYKKRNVYVFLYMFYTNILCECVCVCLRNGLSSHKCCNYLHARLSSISICRDCSKSLRHKHTLIHTHTLMYTLTSTLTHTHTHSHTHTCPASPRLVFRLSILHMHLCWHYYNTRPTLPPYPPSFHSVPLVKFATLHWSCKLWLKFAALHATVAAAAAATETETFILFGNRQKRKLQNKNCPPLYTSLPLSLLYFFSLFPFASL